jgi:hypothetical protein
MQAAGDPIFPVSLYLAISASFISGSRVINSYEKMRISY